MAAKRSLLLSLLASLIYTLAYASQQSYGIQQTFQHHEPNERTGILRRFQVHDSKELEILLEAVQVNIIHRFLSRQALKQVL
jgi:hypothetical protein